MLFTCIYFFMALIILSSSYSGGAYAAHTDHCDCGNLKPVEVALRSDVIESQKICKDRHEASTLVVRCMDFRLVHETGRLLSQCLSLKGDYDEVVLPGASLSYTDATHPHWGQSIDDAVGLAKDMDRIKRVIFMDHMDCGVYKKIKANEVIKDEVQTHRDILKAAKVKLKQKYPDLEIHTILMGFDGKAHVFKE